MLQLRDDVGADRARLRALRRRRRTVTLMSSSMSPWSNLSTSSWVAFADSDVGSWKPPADRLLATGMPKIPQRHHDQQRDAMMRRGAAMARYERFVQHVRPPCPIDYRR